MSDTRWQPIETAPENENVLLWEPQLRQAVIGEKRNGKWPWFYQPSHWMPLPEPPDAS